MGLANLTVLPEEPTLNEKLTHVSSAEQERPEPPYALRSPGLTSHYRAQGGHSSAAAAFLLHPRARRDRLSRHRRPRERTARRQSPPVMRATLSKRLSEPL
jgi:hypothetical protein